MSRPRKQQRPQSRRANADRMKVHLRVVETRRATFRVVTLRPGARFFFSTNYFHDTWHILSEPRGAGLLGRLMWGLSYQRQAGTVVLIEGKNILRTPFGGERSDSILLMLAGGQPYDRKTLQLLRKRLGRPTDRKTIRWHTQSYDQTLRSWRETRQSDPTEASRLHEFLHYRDSEKLFAKEQMWRQSGFVCYAAPPQIMRVSAVGVGATGDYLYNGMDYTYLAENMRWPQGEVQVFDNYLQRCSAATTARAETLAEGREFADEASLYAVIAHRRDSILRAQRRNIRNRGSPHQKMITQLI